MYEYIFVYIDKIFCDIWVDNSNFIISSVINLMNSSINCLPTWLFMFLLHFLDKITIFYNFNLHLFLRTVLSTFLSLFSFYSCGLQWHMKKLSLCVWNQSTKIGRNIYCRLCLNWSLKIHDIYIFLISFVLFVFVSFEFCIILFILLRNLCISSTGIISNKQQGNPFYYISWLKPWILLEYYQIFVLLILLVSYIKYYNFKFDNI